MRNQPIQLSNDVTVTLFLYQSSQNFALCLEMTISTPVQNFNRIQFFILPWQHILWRLLLTNRVLKISDDVTVTPFLNQSQQNSVFCLLYQEASLCKIWAKSDKKQRSCKNGKWRHCDVISKKSSAIFCAWVFLLIPIDVPSFKLIEGQIKELQGMGPNTPPGWECPK